LKNSIRLSPWLSTLQRSSSRKCHRTGRLQQVDQDGPDGGIIGDHGEADHGEAEKGEAEKGEAEKGEAEVLGS